jgi:hypothetical protein
MKDALMDEPLLTPSEIESYLTDLRALQEGKLEASWALIFGSALLRKWSGDKRTRKSVPRTL